MKNILRTTFFALLLITTLASCEDDNHQKVYANDFALRTTTLATPLVLTPLNDNDVVAVLDWDKSNNGLATISTYKVEISDHIADPNSEQPITANLGNNINVTNDLRTYTLTVKEVNSLVNRLPSYQCGQELQIDIKIKSTLGAGNYNEFIQRSNPITINVTPYSTALPTLAFATAASSSGTASKLAASSIYTSADYEGFFYLTPGTYKFYKPDSCNGFGSPTSYGINAGALVLDGTDGYIVTAAGHYFVKANLATSTYTIAPFTAFGIFGKATKTALFGNNTPMAYDTATKKWKLTWQLIDGKKFSFRAVTAPATVLTGSTGPSLSVSTGAVDNEGTIKAPGTYVSDATKTNYDIEVDLSNPRNYTYTLTPH